MWENIDGASTALWGVSSRETFTEMFKKVYTMMIIAASYTTVKTKHKLNFFFFSVMDDETVI